MNLSLEEERVWTILGSEPGPFPQQLITSVHSDPVLDLPTSIEVGDDLVLDVAIGRFYHFDLSTFVSDDH